MFRKKVKKQTYDKENLRPVIRSSICTGEQVAGFRNTYDISEADIGKEY